MKMMIFFDCEDQMKNNNEENSLRILFPWSLFRQSDLAPLMETETVQDDDDDDDDDEKEHDEDEDDNEDEDDMQELFYDVHYGFVFGSIGKQPLIDIIISCLIESQGGGIEDSDNVTNWLTEALSFL